MVEGFPVEWSRISTTGTPCLTGRIGAFRKSSSGNPERMRALQKDILWVEHNYAYSLDLLEYS